MINYIIGFKNFINENATVVQKIKTYPKETVNSYKLMAIEDVSLHLNFEIDPQKNKLLSIGIHCN